MSSPLRNCSLCNQTFWSTEPPSEVTACPGCSAMTDTTPHPGLVELSADFGEHPRFVSLSALPPEKRVPPRRDGTRPGLMVPRRLAQISGSPSPEPPRQEAVPSPQNLLQERRLGFNCPSCFVVLIIKEPDQYDGRAAPCPSCGVAILPPRLAVQSPFTLISPPLPPPLPPTPRARQPRAFGRHRAIHNPAEPEMA